VALAPPLPRRAAPRHEIDNMRVALAALVPLLSGCGAIAARAIVGPMGAGPDPLEPGRPLELTAADGTHLHGFVVQPAGRPRGTVLLLHGVASRGAFWRDEAVALARAGYTAAAWDQRGHGRSGGLCSYGAREAGDVSVLLDALDGAGLLVRPVVLYGYSMGGAVAIQAAARERRIDGVAAVAPFATLAGIIRRTSWGAPAAELERAVASAERRARFRVAAVRPVEDARRARTPLLVIVGALDLRAPLEDARAIVAAAAGPATLLVVPGADHGDVLPLCGPPCSRALGRLLERAASGRRHAPAKRPLRKNEGGAARATPPSSVLWDASQVFLTLAAWSPFGPSTMSNSTSCPSDRVRNPSPWMAVWWTKTSGPSGREMKP
jgi:pimeloyl-ACP methyl ester carboxylesterase